MIGADAIGSHAIASTELLLSPGPVFNVTINGVDLTGNVYIGADGSQAVSISDILTGASTCELNLIDLTGPNLDIEVGHEVIIQHEIGRLFGGTVEDIRMANPQAARFVRYSLTLKDYSACLERRLVAASFEDTGDPITQTVGDVVELIFNLVLADGCITLGTIEDGPLIQKVNFNYVTATQAFNDLQRLTGGTYQWRVDYFGVLTFRERDAVASPYDIIGVDELTMRSFDFSESRETYRNRQTVRGGKTESDPRTDNFEADGKNKTFVCSLPLSGKPVIEVNGSPVSQSTIGIKGADQDDPAITWFYAIDDPDVSARVAPTITDDIDITYTGLFPIIVQRELPAEIAARAAIEPGDGIYEALETDENLDLIGSRTLGDALLEKYGRIPKRISYLTQKDGLLQAGMLQQVEFARFGSRVTAAYMIESVEIRLLGEIVEYSVAATEGKELLEWLDFWRKVIRGRAPFLLRDNEKIVLPLTLSDQLEVTDSTTVVLANELTSYEDDPYTVPIFNIGGAFGKKIEDGSSDGPHLGPVLGTIGLLAGLQFYYKLDEASGTRFDSHFNALNMAQTGSVPSGSGALGTAADHTGNSSNILDRVHSDLFRIGGGPATVNAWIAMAAGTGGVNHPMISHWNSNGGATERGWVLWYRSSSGRMRFSVSDDGVGTTITEVDWGSAPPLDSSWHMVTGFHDPANARVGIAVDNGTIVWAAHVPATVNPTTTARPALGVFRGSTVIVGLNKTDETAMWNRLLLPAEVTRLYGGGVPLSYDNFR